MDIYYSGDFLPYDECAVALGEFDGLHKAHMKIIEAASESGLPAGVMYFSENPKTDATLLMSERQKQDLLIDCDYIYIQDFDEAFKNKSCDEFAQFLTGTLHAVEVYAGYNYRFGKNASGDAVTLTELGKEYGFGVHIISEVTLNGEHISSSVIRELIKNGDMKKTGELLGRYYSIDGEIIRGKQNGHKLGFPTVNIDYDKRVTLPMSGVYAGYTFVEGQKHKSVINVGNNPTFNADKISIESHILDFDGYLYGEFAEVEFVSFIRSEIKFNGLDELSAQIEKDKSKALEILDKEV